MRLQSLTTACPTCLFTSIEVIGNDLLERLVRMRTVLFWSWCWRMSLTAAVMAVMSGLMWRARLNEEMPKTVLSREVTAAMSVLPQSSRINLPDIFLTEV